MKTETAKHKKEKFGIHDQDSRDEKGQYLAQRHANGTVNAVSCAIILSIRISWSCAC